MAAQSIDYAALAKQAGAISSTPASGIDYTALAKQAGATSSTPAQATSGPDLDKQLHEAYDNRPLWRKALGLQPENLSPELQQHYNQIIEQAKRGAGERLKDTAAAYGEGAITAAKTLPFLALGPAGGAIADAVGGGVVGTLANAATQGVGGAAIAKLEGASNSGAAATGALQAAGPIASKALEAAGPYLQKAAAGQYIRALSPTTAKNKALAQKIAPEMIDRGMTGSLSSINDGATQAADAVRPSLDRAYDALEAQTPQIQGAGRQILDRLESLKGKYVVGGNIANPQAVNAINSVQDIVQQYGNDISPKTLRGLKAVFDDPVAQAGGFTGADLATKFGLKAQKTAADTIRGIVHDASPDIDALDKEISFQLAAKKLTAASDLRKTGQEGGLSKVFAPLATGVAGTAGFVQNGAQGGLEAALGVAGAATVAQVLRSPWWRTLSAVRKDAIANALIAGDGGRVVTMLTKLGAPIVVSQSGDQQSPQASPQQ